jgi:hypothetical protein
MPKTYSLLKNSVREVLLVKNKKNEVVRVLNRYDESEAEFYSYFSNLPKSTNHIARDFPVFLKNAPHKFLGMYQKHLDGLFDASLAGGFLSLSDMEPLSKHIENFTDFSWYETIKQTKQLENIYMIFSSGGGGYLYLDLNQDQSNSDAPECILITNNPDDTLEYVPFWECLDAWMSISMGA